MTSHSFDREYWQQHWHAGASHDQSLGGASHSAVSAHPYLVEELDGLMPGSALDAGCGRGAEARWLANAGWRVTAVDISDAALDEAQKQTARDPAASEIEWLQADLTRWQPGRQWQLVISSYAHAEIAQLDLYQRLGSLVQSGGTLLLVAHDGSHDIAHDEPHGAHGGAQGDTLCETAHPAAAAVTAAQITSYFDRSDWQIDTARHAQRMVGSAGNPQRQLNDVVVRLTRQS